MEDVKAPVGTVLYGSKLMHRSDLSDLEIWKTSSGKYTVYDPVLELALKSNIRDYDTAIGWIKKYEGEYEDEERVVVSRKIGQTPFPGWTYLGGSEKFQVWASPAGKYQISLRHGEEPIVASVSESKLPAVLSRIKELQELSEEEGLGKDFSYQMILSGKETGPMLPSVGRSGARTSFPGAKIKEGERTRVLSAEEVLEPYVREYVVRELPSGELEGLPPGYEVRKT